MIREKLLEERGRSWVDGFYLFIYFLICEGLVISRERVCQGCDLLGGSICRELGQLPLESFLKRIFCLRISQGSVPWYALVAHTIFQTGAFIFTGVYDMDVSEGVWFMY